MTTDTENITPVIADTECVSFLQWVLPQMQMRWQGFRKVHHQVCKRLTQRLVLLRLVDLESYQQYLQQHPDEWLVLDRLCCITVSRFNRDRMVFAKLAQQILPELASMIRSQSGYSIRLWSAGCASGEEPYTLKLIWQILLANRFPEIQLQITATDINPQLLQRADTGCYEYSSIKRLPTDWQQQAFVKKDHSFCLEEQYKHDIDFIQHDIRQPMKAEPFHLILCRNLAFTYYSPQLQQQVLDNINSVLQDNGLLVIGVHEYVNDAQQRFKQREKMSWIMQKVKE